MSKIAEMGGGKTNYKLKGSIVYVQIWLTYLLHGAESFLRS